MARPSREMRSRRSVADSDQRSEYSSTSHHSSYDLGTHVMSTINLTHEMAEIKKQLARSAAIRADAWPCEKEPSRKRHVPTSGLTTSRSRCETCSTIQSKISRGHARTASVSPNQLPKSSRGNDATSDACRCPPTCWKQRDRLTAPCAVNTARERKNQQERPGPSCK
jgi:hypothetical protein